MATVEERLQRLEDEAAIRDLVSRFADAESRNDQAAALLLWLPDGVFTINQPFLHTARGTQQIGAFLTELRGSKELFVQFVHSGVVELDGLNASARWLIREVAKGGDTFYHNFGFFDDRFEKREGKWFFRERSYHYVYLDLTPFPGEALALPPELGAH